MRNLVTLSFLLFLAGAPGATWAQTSAADWFKTGMNATTTEDKIQAFEKVIELEPDYVEAYFYLGLAYKAKQNYTDAELALNQAYFKNPYVLNKEIKTRILFELGTVYALQEKLREAEDALKGAKRMTSATDRMRGRICYELGRLYLQRDEIELALSELSEGKQLLPQDAERFDRVIDQANRKKDLEDKYKNAVAFLNKERYQQAITLFNEILSSDSEFKDAKDLLKQAQTAQQQNEKNTELLSLYEEAVTKADTGELQPAIELMRQVVNADPEFRDARTRLQNLESQLRTRQQENQRQRALERAYSDGVAAVRNRNWKAAVSAFEKVLAIDADYRNTQALIEQARKAVQMKATEQTRSAAPSENSRAQNLYEAGVAAIENEQWRQAFESFKELKTIDPDYKDIQDRLKRIRDALKQSLATEADSLHQVGLAALQNGDWLDAVNAFEQVKTIDPDYDNIDNRLADARFNLQRSRTKSPQPETSNGGLSLTFIGTTVTLLLIPLAIGFLIFAPGTRARLYLMRGEYAKAAEIYEKMLLKNPDKLKLYPILGNIYLLENRRDPQAMRVFETIIKHKLATHQRREITSIIANYYLTEGRNDSTAIAVLEQELDARLQKSHKE